MLTLEHKAGCKAQLEGFYSRAVLKSGYCYGNGPCAAGKPESLEKSGFLKRWFWPESQTITFVAKVGVRPDVAGVSRQLVLLTHNDDSADGESANIELLDSEPALTPYFLVKPETVIDVAMSAKLQSKLTTGAVKMLARITQQATGLLAPQSALATKLAQPVIQTQADNADKWLDMMFSFQDAETVTAAIEPAAIATDGALGFGGWLRKAGDKDKFAQAANWVIAWDNPRVSMFAATTIPCGTDANAVPTLVRKAGAAIEPSQVLGTAVGGGKTVRDLISAETWYRDASTKIGNTKDRVAGISEFCGRVPGLMLAQNFNATDAGAVLWAALLDTPGIGDLKDLATIPICSRYHSTMTEFGLIDNKASQSRVAKVGKTAAP